MISPSWRNSNKDKRTVRPLRGLITLCLGGTLCACCLSGLSFSLPTRLADTGVSNSAASPLSGGTVEQRQAIGTINDDGQTGHGLGLQPAANFAQPPQDTFSGILAGTGAATALTAIAMRATEGGQQGSGKSSGSAAMAILPAIGAWYFLNIAFNIYNKKALLLFPFPWTMALFQMAFGMLLFGPLWATGLRKTPKLTTEEVVTLLPAALGHVVTHGGAAVSFASGAVSFTQIVKASEPVASAVLNYLFMGEVLAFPVLASLIPIIGGVGLASASELSFTWLSFNAAMISNLASAGRSVYSKKVMGKDIGKNMDSANFYAVITILSTLLLLPIAFVMEGPTAILKGLQTAYATGGPQFLWHLVYSGFFYYVYNEVAFLALSKLDPVSHAVANTMKRVGIIVTAVIVFNTPVTTLGTIGSAVAILGALAYTLAQNAYK